MKCPYAVHRYSTTNTAIRYDDDGRECGSTVMNSNTAMFVNCLESECGAYNTEKNCCEYNGGVK